MLMRSGATYVGRANRGSGDLLAEGLPSVIGELESAVRGLDRGIGCHLSEPILGSRVS